MREIFPVAFQWFVLISTTILAGFICRSMILSFIKKPIASSKNQENEASPKSQGATPDTNDKTTSAANPKRHVKTKAKNATSATATSANVTSELNVNEHGELAQTHLYDKYDKHDKYDKYDKPPFYTIRQPAFWHIIILAALSRVILYGVAYLASRVFIDSSGSFLGTLPKLWQRSDAPHYISIAENWYVNTGEDRVFLVFLPLYPILIKLFAFVFGNAIFSGIFVSLISYIAACVLFYEIALLIGQDENTAYHAVKYAVFFPASFFINGAFSEGLFLLTSALFFHYLLRKKWTRAACFGLLASFTRYYGLLLAAPYAIELIQTLKAPFGTTGGAKIGTTGGATFGTKVAAHRAGGCAPAASSMSPSQITKCAAPILLIPAGTGLYLIINYAISGSFFQFLIYQRDHWNQHFAFFFDNMRNLAVNAFEFPRATSATLFIPQIICIILYIALLSYGVISKFRVSLLAYLGVYFLLSISAFWMLSFPRYIFGAAPMFPLMSSLGSKSRAADALVSMVCFAGLIFLTIAYTCGFHVY